VRPTADCAAALNDVMEMNDVMQMNDVMEKSVHAWLLFPKGQEHIRVSQPPAPEGRCKR
jgi:hypothetical protein